MSDSITSVIGLKDSDIDYCREVIRKENNKDCHLIYVRLLNRGGICRICGTFTKRIKEYRNKEIEHAKFLNERCTIIYSARRFTCPKCGTTFFEKDPFQSQYRNISDTTVKNVLGLLKQYNQTFASVGRSCGLTRAEVIKIFDEHVQVKRRELSECVGMDEFYFSRKASKKYALMILSLNKGYVIDMRPNREKLRIISYFRTIPKQERDRVKYFSIDMNDNYREAIQICFPDTHICADPFHVIKYLNDALDNVRLRILRMYSEDRRSDNYYLLKYRKDLLYHDVEFNDWKEVKYNHHFKYQVSEKRLQEMILDIHPDLFKAWNLKERYMRFDKADLSEQDRSSHLAKLIDDFISSDIPEMMSMGLTLSNWRQEILNSFHTMNKKVTSSDGSRKSITARVTSGPVEGRNKYIKILLKLANGYVNFNRFRNRAMYVLNRSESYSSDKLENGIPHRQK
jgi:transposase